MKPQTKIYIGLAIGAIFAIGIIGGSAWSNRTIAKLENAVEEARQTARDSQQAAHRKEIEAAAFKEKTRYLETQLKEIQTIARKHDEELKTIFNNSSRARGDVERARRTRSIAATAQELCAKLAELGHGCE